MHQVLRIADIMHNLCECTDRHTLCAVARTTRDWHEPAIQAIWRVVPSLVPLFLCFPQETWTLETGIFKFTRTLKPSDWGAFRKYARLIRHITPRSDPPKCALYYGWDALTWQTMCSLRPASILLPNLRSLHTGVSGLQGEDVPSLLMCIGTRLLDVHIIITKSTDSQNTLQEACKILSERFATLRRLEVRTYQEWNGTIQRDTADSLSRLACSLRSLESFVSPDIPIMTLAHLLDLASSETLRHFSACLPNAVDWLSVDVKRNLVHQPFAHLKRFELSATVQAYIPFSRAIPLPHITEFILRVNGDPHPPRIAELFTSVRNQFSPTVLHHLSICHEYSSDDVPDVLAFIRPSDLRPLLEFKQLTFLKIGMRCQYALDDEAYAAMAQAWPEMVRLSVGAEDHCLHAELPSLRALPPFAVHCPKLESLALQLIVDHWEDADDFSMFDASEEVYGKLAHSASTSTLKELTVGTPAQFVPEVVAAFLARVFPDLVELYDTATVDVIEPEVFDCWRTVRELRPLFKRIRRDERLRMTQEMSGRAASSQTAG